MKRLSTIITIVLALTIVGFVGRGMLHRADYQVAVGAESDPASAFSDGRANLVGATFYSAWCSACAVLDPKLRDVVPEFDGRAVEFTKFDFSIGQPETLTTKAEALGVKSVYLQNKGATGFMALIDRRDQSVIAIISMRDSKDDIRTKIEAGIKTASKPLERMTL